MSVRERFIERRRREHPLAQHIGNNHGRIAIWLDEGEAHDLAALYGSRDAAFVELMGAIERAYPDAGDTEETR